MPDSRLAEAAAEESLDALYTALSEVEVAASRKAQSDEDREMAQAAISLRLARQFTYQAFRVLRHLSGHLAGIHQVVHESIGRAAAPPCCPGWSLAVNALSWMQSPDDPSLLIQPSIKGADGTLLPILVCPFCGVSAPTKMRIEPEQGDEIDLHSGPDELFWVDAIRNSKRHDET